MRLFIKVSDANRKVKTASMINAFCTGVNHIAAELTAVAGIRPTLTAGFREGLSSMKPATGGLIL